MSATRAGLHTKPKTKHVPLDLNGLSTLARQGFFKSLREFDEATAAAEGRPTGTSPHVRAEFEREGVTPPAERVVSRKGWTAYERAFDGMLRGKGESRDLGQSTGAGGGYLVPTAFADSVYQNLGIASVFWSKCSPILKTPDGRPMLYPATATAEASNASGAQTENTQITGTDVAFRQLSFGVTPWYLVSNLQRYSRALAQDASVDIASILAVAASARIAVATDRDFAATFVPAITKTVTSVAPTAVSYVDLLNMFYSLSLAHRGASGTAWLMWTATAQAMRAIVDGSGRPVMLDQPLKSAAAGDEDFGSTQPVAFASVPTMFGVPVYEVGPATTALGGLVATQTSIVLANFASAFVIRVASSFETQILVERYSDYGELAAIFRARIDGVFNDSASAVKLVQHA